MRRFHRRMPGKTGQPANSCGRLAPEPTEPAADRQRRGHGADRGEGSHVDPGPSARTSGRPPTRPCRSADRSEVKLLDYTQLYKLWERQQWAHPGPRLLAGPDRLARAHPRRRSASSACTGSPASSSASRRSPTSSGRSCAPRRPRTSGSSSRTQIADEARHVRFFDRFYSEVGVLEGADELSRAARGARRAPQRRRSGRSSTSMLKERVDRLGASPRTARRWSRRSRSTTW